MSGFRTLGQREAVAAARAMLLAGIPHAVVLAGPAGVGKTTLALDIAAALMCTADDPGARPCRACRACRMVEHGNHPDIHRLVPRGPGGAIPIGGKGEGGVRDLVRDLSLLPVEGGARVAIVEAAQRMTDDAQSAFLKTLEEPPAGTTILLCADDEDRLLPTIRSRCARIRLGPLGIRDVEAVLVARGDADAPTAARLARITGGRPGHAIAYALAPNAAPIRGEITRTLLDLLASGPSARISGVRDLAGRAADLVRELDADEEGAEVAASSDEPVARIAASERRRGALALVAIWRSVLRDLALVGRDATASVRELDLVDDLRAAAARLGGDRPGAFLHELDIAGERLEGNVSPELVLDVLALHWTAEARVA
ncbi:MAG: family ATPase [Chloroflexi bacterium]|nr:family ATPase [Chloroflexota bacterium]